jgi:O-antigen/teichoic acid export membrane protein
MSKARLIIRNFILIFSSNVIGQLFYLGGLIHLARTFGPVGFGLWNFAQAWLIYLLRGGEMGFEVIGVKEIARHPDRTPNLITAVITSRCILLLILATFLFIAIECRLIPEDVRILVVIFSLSLIPMAFILEWVFEGHQSLLSVSIARIAKGVIFFILVVLFVKSTYDVTLSSFFYVISLTVPILYVGWSAVRSFGMANFRETFYLLPQLWRSALPVGCATLLSNYSLFIGTMVIGYTMQHDQLGYYTASHRMVIFLWAYIIANLQRVVLPTLSNLFQISSDSFQSFVERFLRFAAMISIGIGLSVTLFSKIIIKILYTERYAASVPILQILVWAFVMASIRAILEIALLASDRQKMYFIGMIFVATLYTMLTPFLVSIYGINGAAYAALISESSYLVFLVVLWSRERYSIIWKSIVKFFIAGSIAIGLLFTIQWNIVFASSITVIVYLGLLLLLKVYSVSELTELPKLAREIFTKEKIYN